MHLPYKNFPFPSSTITFTVNDQPITSKFKQIIHQESNSNNQLMYLENKNHWLPSTIKNIAWKPL